MIAARDAKKNAVANPQREIDRSSAVLRRHGGKSCGKPVERRLTIRRRRCRRLFFRPFLKTEIVHEIPLAKRLSSHYALCRAFEFHTRCSRFELKRHDRRRRPEDASAQRREARGGGIFSETRAGSPGRAVETRISAASMSPFNATTRFRLETLPCKPSRLPRKPHRPRRRAI